VVVWPRWTGGSSEKYSSGDGGSGARGEMRVRERAKWREWEIMNALDQQIRVREARTALATTAAVWWPGRARQRWGDVERAEAGRRGARQRRGDEELGRRVAWRRHVGATRVENGVGRAAAAVSGGGLRRPAAAGGSGSGVARSGEASRGALRRWASSRATRGGQERQGEASGGVARWPAAVLLHGRGGRGRRRGGGARG
jgi:hypothetical protein